jgi:polysaccharide export outer membrane protein
MNVSTSWHKVISACAVLIFIVAVRGPAQEQTPPPTAEQPNADKKVATVPLPNTAGAPVDSGSYKIGPNDVLNIRVWNEPEFTGPVSVHQDGKITLPLVGDLQAGGKTPNEVQETIAEALKTLVKKPLVTVTVQDVGSKRYYLDGLAARPGEYPLVVPTTILEAISKAGGLQDFANAKKIYILRGDKKIYFNYKDVLHGKHMEQNIQLQPGDHIVVP